MLTQRAFYWLRQLGSPSISSGYYSSKQNKGGGVFPVVILELLSHISVLFDLQSTSVKLHANENAVHCGQPGGEVARYGKALNCLRLKAQGPCGKTQCFLQGNVETTHCTLHE